MTNLIKHFEKNDEINSYQLTGNLLSAAAGRLAYFFDLRGQAMSIDTSTSSSLVAVHNACQDLRDEDCDLAIAAGVNLMLSPIQSIALSKTNVLSKDGKCKTFDAKADGYVRSEGCGVIILKRLEDAIRDQNSILGIIRSTAVNQNGHSSDLIALSQEAHEMLLKKALEAADLMSEDIDYIEAHGSATLRGDLTESTEDPAYRFNM